MKNKLKEMVEHFMKGNHDAATEAFKEAVNAEAVAILHEAKKIGNDDPEEKMVPVENVRKGTFVRRTTTAKKTYQADGYCKLNRKYMFSDYEDSSREIGLKKGTMVFVGFEY